MRRTASTLLLPLGLLGLSAPAIAQLGAPPVPPENPITEAKRVLGKALFWEEQLSSDSTVACGTCHIPATGGADPRVGNNARHPGLDGLLGGDDDKFGSLGVRTYDDQEAFDPDGFFGFEPQVTERLANSMIGAAHFSSLFWDGRGTSEFIDPETGLVSIPNGGALESQAVGPILSDVEMGHEGRTWDDVRERLESVRPMALAFNLPGDLAAITLLGKDYPELFTDAFGDAAITAERIAYAIATYERTLNPDQTPFDAFAAGQQNALTQNQRNGLNAFNSPQSRCNQCHAGPNFSDGSFRNLGLRPLMEDQGRRDVTGIFSDRGKFKVPSLRNVGLRERFFHNGEFTSLVQIMGFYNQDGGDFDGNKDPLMNGLSVPPQVGQSIVDFLANGLTDPRVAAGLPPFDRPSLNSERAVPAPVSMGGARAGSAGQTPQLLAPSQGAVGDPTYHLGITNGLGGAMAAIGWSMFPAGTGGPMNQNVLFLATPRSLAPGGAGDGYATWLQPMPSSPAMVGSDLFAQGYVRDPAAQGRVALTQQLRITLF